MNASRQCRGREALREARSDSCDASASLHSAWALACALQREVVAIESEPGGDFPSRVIALTSDRVKLGIFHGPLRGKLMKSLADGRFHRALVQRVRSLRPS